MSVFHCIACIDFYMDIRLTVSVSLQNKTTYGPEKAYQGSFFAFVNDNENSPLQGEKATLHSNVIISGKFVP